LGEPAEIKQSGMQEYLPAERFISQAGYFFLIETKPKLSERQYRHKRKNHTYSLPFYL
jgi:hypothetical protein